MARTHALILSSLALSLSACVSGTDTAASATEPTQTQTETAPILGPGDRQPSGRTLGTRSAVVAPNAAAATAHPLATQVALDIMKDGGTAIDAAIAANAMLGLVEPTGNGIGGDLFAIVWDPKTEKLYGYNGSGRSPMGATLADMQAEADAHENGEKIPAYGVAPISVPGTVDGWFALHERFGRLSMRDNLKPTIEYARNGAPIPEVIAYYWDRSERNYARFVENGMIDEFDNARETFFSPTPREGSLFRNPDLANTLTTIAFNGRDAFYKGSLARTMDSYMERIGGFMTYEDLAAHEGEWIEPICVTYRDEVSLCELGPNTQGVAALQMLQMLERFDLREMGWGSADATMAQVEAKRLAFADRALGYADPEYTNIKPEDFANPVYNQARGARIDLNKAMPTEDTLSNLVVSDEGYEFLISNRDKLAATILSESDTLPDWFQQWEETGLFDGAMVAGGSEETETDRDIFILANPEKVQKIEECLSRENGDLSGGWVLYPPLGDLNCSDGQADWGRDFFGDQIDDLRKANAKLQDGDTTYLTVTHKDGMMVSLIQSNYRGMGSGLVPDGLGFMLQDRGQLFSLDPDHPNVFEPGKRPFHTIIPAFAYKNVEGSYEPWLSFGLMGGGMQPQGHVQIILNLVDFDMGLQEAGDAARWEHRGGCEPTDNLEGDECGSDLGTIWLESGIPEETRAELERRGHTIKCCQANGGGYQAIMRDFETGAWIAATEMRKDGNADGY